MYFTPEKGWISFEVSADSFLPSSQSSFCANSAKICQKIQNFQWLLKLNETGVLSSYHNGNTWIYIHTHVCISYIPNCRTVSNWNYPIDEWIVHIRWLQSNRTVKYWSCKKKWTKFSLLACCKGLPQFLPSCSVRAMQSSMHVGETLIWLVSPKVNHSCLGD